MNIKCDQQHNIHLIINLLKPDKVDCVGFVRYIQKNNNTERLIIVEWVAVRDDFDMSTGQGSGCLEKY